MEGNKDTKVAAFCSHGTLQFQIFFKSIFGRFKTADNTSAIYLYISGGHQQENSQTTFSIMKKSILGSFIGLSIVISIDAFARVIFALFFDVEIPMISYTAFPGIITPALLTAIAAVSALLGALFSLTYGKKNKIVSLFLYTLLLMLIRYGQIHLLYGTETIVYPILALVLSLIAIFFAWKILQPKKAENSEEFSQHHQPAADQPSHPPH